MQEVVSSILTSLIDSNAGFSHLRRTMPFKDKRKQSAYQNRWTLERRRSWLKANGPCAQCGSTVDLQVDHIDPRTKVSHRIWTWAEARRLRELKKCQALCLVCHKAKTAAARKAAVKHGSYAMRNSYDCRCAKCMKYVRESKERWRARTGRN